MKKNLVKKLLGLSIILTGVTTLNSATVLADNHKHNHFHNIQVSPTENFISIEQARDIAFKDAGVNRSNVRKFKYELDMEYGMPVYEIEWKIGFKEYEYNIDAIGGRIMKKKIDNFDM